MISKFSSLPLPSRRGTDHSGGSAAIHPTPRGSPRRRRSREQYTPRGGQHRQQRQRSRSPRRDTPRLRPNDKPIPQKETPKTDAPLDMSMFADVNKLREFIQKAAQQEVLKLSSTSVPTHSRYGPPVLTPNNSGSGELTPRSTATTRINTTPRGEMQESDEEYHPPTVESCLYEAFHFNRDFRMRTAPPFPDEDYRKGGANKKRALQKTHSYRAKRASQSKEIQRQAKWDALIKRARKAATAGRVKVLLINFLSLFTWVKIF